MRVGLRAGFRAPVLAIGLALVAAGGCGPSKANVSGKVTYKGKPVVWGTVTLVGSDGITYTGQINPDGTFTVPSVPVGTVKVGVSSPNPDPAARDGGRGGPGGAVGFGGRGEAPAEPAPPGVPLDKWFPLPDQYKDPVNSGLTADVKAGQPVNLDLK